MLHLIYRRQLNTVTFKPDCYPHLFAGMAAVHIATPAADTRSAPRPRIAEKDQAQVSLCVEVVNAPQGRRVATRALGSGQANGLIGT